MLRTFLLSLAMLFVVYILPFTKESNELTEVSVPFLPEFSIKELFNVENTPDISNDSLENIIVCIDGVNTTINIDEFLVGVVSAEMPASFETEALKAQAVAGRTYIYYKQWLIDEGKSDNVHDGAVVCNDPAHCKAYIDIETKNPWGDYYELYKTKITQAVYDTSNEYIIYNNEPIAAVFHAASSGITEKAEDVWGTDIPYLQAVESEGSKVSPNYSNSISVSLDDFKTIFLNSYPTADFSVEKELWFRASTRSESGGIISVYVGGVLIDGADIRTLFKLNSTNFTIEYTDDYIIFHTLGYGHGVGLSQYGANALAKDGLTYNEILSWYYKDTQITKK